MLRGVEALTQTCPATAPSGGPYRARTWDALSRGEVRYGAAGARTVALELGQTRLSPGQSTRSAAGAPAPARRPRTRRARPPTVSPPPRARATRCSARPCSAHASRSPAATRRWRHGSGTWRPTARRRPWWPARSTGPRPGKHQVFQLHPNGWQFAAGHVPKLELVGKDSAYGRPSNFDWSIKVSALKFRLPVRDKAGRRGEEAEAPVQALGGRRRGRAVAVTAVAASGQVSPLVDQGPYRPPKETSTPFPRAGPSDSCVRDGEQARTRERRGLARERRGRSRRRLTASRSSRSSRAESAGSARWRTPSAAPS